MLPKKSSGSPGRPENPAIRVHQNQGMGESLNRGFCSACSSPELVAFPALGLSKFQGGFAKFREGARQVAEVVPVILQARREMIDPPQPVSHENGQQHDAGSGGDQCGSEVEMSEPGKCDQGKKGNGRSRCGEGRDPSPANRSFPAVSHRTRGHPLQRGRFRIFAGKVIMGRHGREIDEFRIIGTHGGDLYGSLQPDQQRADNGAAPELVEHLGSN